MTAPRPAGRADFGPHFVQSVARVIAVLRSFSAERSRQSLSEVAQATGLDRAVARRLLLTLADLGYVARVGKGFELTPRVLELGYAYLSSQSLPEIAHPHLRRLADDLNETAALAVLDEDHIVYVALVPSARLAVMNIDIGTRFEAYATSMGRVLLAGLGPEQLQSYLGGLKLEARTGKSVRTAAELLREIQLARTRGWSLVDSELEEGLCGAAAPVRDRTGKVVAAVNVSVHAGRTSQRSVEREYVPMILRTAARIEADLGPAER